MRVDRILDELRNRPEHKLIRSIRDADSESERRSLIQTLESTPVDNLPFYRRWLSIHKPYALQCWTEDGYQPELSDLPTELQLLPAVCYAISDINNGGFHQLFSNGTGVMAPEMQQWCEDAGLSESAKILNDAIAIFGDQYPRSQLARQDFLTEFAEEARVSGKGSQRGLWAYDPFDEMNQPFYNSLADFDDAADRWLREVCGVTSLHTAADSIVK